MSYRVSKLKNYFDKVPYHVRDPCKRNDEISQLKNGHLVSNRRKLFENLNLHDKKKNDKIPDRHTKGIPNTSAAPNHLPEVIIPQPQPTHSVKETRRNVIDSDVKYDKDIRFSKKNQDEKSTNGEFNGLVSLKEEEDDEVNVKRSFSSDDSTKTEDGSFSFADISTFESHDSDDIFGETTEINDFIVETYNNLEENVLYRITLQREPILIPTFNKNNYPALEDCAPSSNSVANEEMHFGVERRNENAEHEKESVDEIHTELSNVYTSRVYDENSNPRITITCHTIPETEKESLSDIPKRYKSQLPSSPSKKQRIIDELHDTEKKYLEDLEYVVLEYLKHFKNHPSVKPIGLYMKQIFGNIEDIFQATDIFYKKLCNCGYSVEQIAQLFLESEELFRLFSDYMRNTFKTQNIYEQYQYDLKVRQRQLNDNKTCDSYLLSPIQRPPKYKLLLENLSKDLRKHGEPNKRLDEAIMFIDQKISEANRLVAIDSIDDCPIDLTDKGRLLLEDCFKIKRKCSGYIFLFENIVVFTTKHKTRHVFAYKDSISTFALSLEYNMHSSSFTLINFLKRKNPKFSKSDSTFEIEAPNPEVCAKWVKEIEVMLRHQLHTLKNFQAFSRL